LTGIGQYLDGLAVKTAQRSMRHTGSAIMLDHYAQTDMEKLIAAQEMILDANFSATLRGACSKHGWMNG